MNDAQIARLEGVRPSSIRDWRRRHGLRQTWRIERAEFLRLHGEGLCDREIAKELGCRVQAVHLYRWRLGLTANKKAKRVGFWTSEKNRLGWAAHAARVCELEFRIPWSEAYSMAFLVMDRVIENARKQPRDRKESYLERFLPRRIVDALRSETGRVTTERVQGRRSESRLWTDPEGGNGDVRREFREVSPAIEDLRTRRMAEMVWVDGMTLREAGKEFGLSESRACQILAEAKRAVAEVVGA